MKYRLLTLVAILTLAGCATAPQTAATKADDEYVTITVTGSNIPKRIKKSDIEAGKLPQGEQMQLVDKDIFGRSLMPGRVVEKGN